MEEPVLKCQFCDEPLNVADSKCEKCGAPVYVNDDVDFSEEDEPGEPFPTTSTQSAFIIAFNYFLLLVFPGILISDQILRFAYKGGRVFSETLLPNFISFLILCTGCVLAGHWTNAEINEGDKNPDSSKKLIKWNLLLSCLLSALILAGLNFYQGGK